MEKNVELSLLLDYYGSMLTDRQRDVVSLYYNGDFSLGEIADDLHISRQGVRDTLKRAEEILVSCEEKLMFLKKSYEFKKIMSEISAIAHDALENEESRDRQRLAFEKIISKTNLYLSDIQNSLPEG